MSYHSYLFLDVEPSIHGIKKNILAAFKKESISFLEKYAGTTSKVRIIPYSTLGLKAGSRIMLHMVAKTPEDIQNSTRDFLHTSMGAHLKITYALFGMTRPSQYKHAAKEESEPADVSHKYLVVYPFTKTIEWHLLPFEKRRSIMKDHVVVGRQFSDSVAQLLLYAYGLDDHEFIVSYQTDSLVDFQTLVMELRSTEARRHTLNDTPIFLCIVGTPERVVSML